MSAPEVVIPLMEGHLGALANSKQNVALFVKMMKLIMLSDSNRTQTDWTFTAIEDIDETSAATATAPESGATLYGILVGQKSADTSEDYLAICDDADGTIAAFAAGDTRVTDVPGIQIRLMPATTDLTEEYWPYVFPAGIPFAAYMSFVADGEDGTNPATDDIRAWVLYRTVAVQAWP